MNEREITELIGSENFPKNDNDTYEIIEKICKQEMKTLKSANQFRDGLKRFIIGEGKVLEESVIKMAESYLFDKNDFSRAPLDPKLAVLYHNNWTKRQYQTTVRKDDIRTIIANKGLGVKEVVTKIIESLTEGRGKEDYELDMKLLAEAPLIDFKTIIGKQPKNMKGVLYMIRKMYNALRFNNNNLTKSHQFVSSTKEEDIRIAFSTDLSNLIDVVELANVLHLEKEALMGKINIFDTSFDSKADKYKYMVFVYDVNALGCAIRVDDLDFEEIKKGRYTNYYLTVEDMRYFTGLFKAVKMDMTDACIEAEKEILTEDVPPTPTMFKVSFNGKYCTSDLPLEVEEGGTVSGFIDAVSGYHFTRDSKFTGIMGGVQLDDTQIYFDDSTGTGRIVVNVANVTGDVTIQADADAD